MLVRGAAGSDAVGRRAALVLRRDRVGAMRTCPQNWTEKFPFNMSLPLPDVPGVGSSVKANVPDAPDVETAVTLTIPPPWAGSACHPA
jgi:hypothetical protein